MLGSFAHWWTNLMAYELTALFHNIQTGSQFAITNVLNMYGKENAVRVRNII